MLTLVRAWCVALLALLGGWPAVAGGLLFPVDCRLGEDCFIQNYVDRDPGPGAVDFTCGPLTYDGHKGTDIRLIDRKRMEAGVTVLSATAGHVVRVRDGLEDAGIEGGFPAGQECGNAVMVRRRDGWNLLYCHLKQGSVRVQPGEPVWPGQPLGQIGMSGESGFPHLHFSVRDPSGRIFDPFDARQQDESCQFRDRHSLWQARGRPGYQAGGPLSAGLLDRMPDYGEIREGAAAAERLPADAPALLFWANFFGLRTGDQILLELTDPKGRVVASAHHLMDRNRATQFRAVGKRARGAWPAGIYAGRARLIRGGAMFREIRAEIAVGCTSDKSEVQHVVDSQHCAEPQRASRGTPDKYP